VPERPSELIHKLRTEALGAVAPSCRERGNRAPPLAAANYRAPTMRSIAADVVGRRYADPEPRHHLSSQSLHPMRTGMCAATIYKLCATDALQHVRVLNSIRVALEWLQEYLARRPADA
jgi:hypothetical protein